MLQKPDRTARSPSILIVDDDPIFGSLASACLGASGYETRTVVDGADALELLVRERFSLAIVDLAMPRVDGFRLIGLVRSTPRHDNMTICVISTAQDADAYEEALRLGADSFLTKPVRWTLLPAYIDSLLQRHRSSGMKLQ